MKTLGTMIVVVAVGLGLIAGVTAIVRPIVKMVAENREEEAFAVVNDERNAKEIAVQTRMMERADKMRAEGKLPK